MELTAPFDVLAWLNPHTSHGRALSDSELVDVLHFSLMWNVFEGRACRRHATVSAIRRFVTKLRDRGRLSPGAFEPYLAHYRARYLTDGEPNERFAQLNFRQGECEPLVEDVLRGNLTDLNNIVLALVLVVYRLWNNLYHGEKNVFSLPGQDESFAVANRLLATLLDLALVWKQR